MKRAVDFRAATGVLLACLIIIFILSSHAQAQTTYLWQGAGTNGITSTDPNDPNTWWWDPNNWVGGVLPAGGTVNFDFSNPGWVYAASASVGDLNVGAASGSGLAIVDGALLEVGGSLVLGRYGAGAGMITQTGGSLSAVYGWVNNSNGDPSAVFAQSGGTASFTKELVLFSGTGYWSAGGTASYLLSGGTLEANACVVAGRDNSVSLFRQTGGVADIDALTIRDDSWSGDGRYELAAGSLSTDYVTLPGGLLVQTGGTHVVANKLHIRDDNGSTGGRYELDAGSLVTYDVEIVGSLACGHDYGGSFVQRGGTHVVTHYLCAGDELQMSFIPALGTYHLDAGLLIATAPTGSGGERIGGESGGLFIQTGGTNSVGHEELVGGAPTWIGGKLTVGYSGRFAGCRGTYVMESGLLRTGIEYIGEGGLLPPGILSPAPGTFVQSGGLHRNEGSMVLGYELGGCGRYELSGGSLWSGSGTVGHRGLGTFTQSGGAAAFSDSLALGYLPGGTGALIHEPGTWRRIELGGTGFYELSGGSLWAKQGTIGYQGHGEFSQSGGTAVFGGSLVLGSRLGGTGIYELSGGSLRAASGTIGYEGYGEFTQSGGTAQFRDRLVLGAQAGGAGVYELSGGSLIIAGASGAILDARELMFVGSDMTVGGAGSGRLVQSGGQAWARRVILGAEAASTGRYELSAGRLRLGSDMIVGSMGTGSFLQTGGTLLGGITLGASPGGRGTYIMTGGSLTAGSCGVGRGGEGFFLQDGGLVEMLGAYQAGLRIGYGGTGSYYLRGGTLRVGVEYIGYDGGCGEFVQQGGTHEIAEELRVGWSVGSLPAQGTFRLEDGLLIGRASLQPYRRQAIGYAGGDGYAGEGWFIQTGGTYMAAHDDPCGTVDQVLYLGYRERARGTYEMDGGVLAGWREYIGYKGGTGLFRQTGGTNLANEVVLGYNSWGYGEYNLSGGSLFAGFLSVGSGGPGLFIQSGGECSVKGQYHPYSAYYALDVNGGVYLLTGGTLNVEGDEVVGAGSLFRQSGGTNSASLNTSSGLGGRLGIGGRYELDSGVLTVETMESIGAGVFAQSGGMNSTADLIIGNTTASPSGAMYELSAGTLNVARGTVGSTGLGVFSQSGGTSHFAEHLITGCPVPLPDWIVGEYDYPAPLPGEGRIAQSGGLCTIGGSLVLGYEPGGTGIYDLSGGSLWAKQGTIGYQGYGQFDQSGGTAVFGSMLVLGHEVGGTGIYDLSGGSLWAKQGTIGYQGYGEFSQSGGTAQFGERLVLGSYGSGTGVCRLSGGTLQVGDLSTYGPYGTETVAVGDAGDGRFIQSGGLAQFGGLVVLGGDAGGTGLYELSGGSLEVGRQVLTELSLVVGKEGVGCFLQSGGQALMGADKGTGTRLVLGDKPGSRGTYVITGGSLSGGCVVGRLGEGLFQQDGGYVRMDGGLAVGAGGTGTYLLSAGMLRVGGGGEYDDIGTDGGCGQFIQQGGTHEVSGWLRIGVGSYGLPGPSHGTYRLDGGLLSQTGRVFADSVGFSGEGWFIQTGGTYEAHAGLRVGRHEVARGTYLMSGGRLDSKYEWIGQAGVGFFWQSGGVNVSGGELCLGVFESATGIYVMTGGSLWAQQSAVGSLGYGQFDQSGGTAKFNDLLTLGRAAGGVGVCQLSDGILQVGERQHIDPATGLLLGGGTLIVGGAGRGLLNQSGGMLLLGEGDLASKCVLIVGSLAHAKGAYQLAGGSLKGDRGIVGYEGDGQMVQSGGSAYLRSLCVGSQPTSTGFYALDDGRLSGGGEVVGEMGQGVFRQTGGTNVAGGLTLGYYAGGNGTYAMDGGYLSGGRFAVGTSGTGSFRQTGGTVKTIGVQIGQEEGAEGSYLLTGGSVSGMLCSVALRGNGYFVQTGGTAGFDVFNIGFASTSDGLCVLAGGELDIAGLSIIARSGKMVQTGGRNVARDIQVDGHYAMYGGEMSARDLRISGQWVLWQGPEVSIGRRLGFGGGASFAAERGAVVRMTGPQTEVANVSRNPVALGGLSRLCLTFDGPDGAVGTLEAAGEDMGAVAAGFVDNFALGVLEVGAGGSRYTLRLLDAFDNQPDWTGREALYVDRLFLRQGAAVETGGLGLYYRNGGEIKRFFPGDATLNGMVNSGDLALLGANWQRTDGAACWSEADFTGDGCVDSGDLALLTGAWGGRTELPPTPGPVPEPASAGLLLALGLGLLRRRR